MAQTYTLSPIEIVKQTGNTILFEQFNKDERCPDLVTILTKDSEELSVEQFINEIKKAKLVVKSYKEFLENFCPTVYETVVMTENGSEKFVYSLDKPKTESKEYKLYTHPFFKMIVNLMDGKSVTDAGNIEFNYDEYKKALSPESELEEYKKIRKQLYSNVIDYYKIKESGKPSVELKRFSKNIIALREKICDKYTNKSALALVPLLIADKQLQIDGLKKVQDKSSDNGNTVTPVVYVKPSIDDKGQIFYIECKSSDDREPSDNNSDDVMLKLASAIRSDYTERAPSLIRNNEFVGNLIVNTFVPNSGNSVSSADLATLEEEKNNLLNIYKESLESFTKAVVKIIEKFIGVKSFFDHATYDEKLADNTSLIIANCKIDAILNDSEAKSRFKKYFGALANEKSTNRIWFGIIPDVLFDENAIQEDDDTPDWDPLDDPLGRSSKPKNSSSSNEQSVSLSKAKEMIEILNEAKIMTFINDNANAKSGFTALTDNKVKDYKDKLESIDSEYTVFCYPNFTILPDEAAQAKIGNVYDPATTDDKNVYAQIPGVYLDSSYVACGMMVGIQNYKLLQSFKSLKIDRKYPCVRFDIEDGDHSKIITTKLNRETTTEMLPATKKAIMEDRFGFVFADNRIIYNGKILKNCYVINSRTLKKGDNGTYKPIFKTLVKNLVDQILRSIDDTVNVDTVSKFKQDFVEGWKKANRDENLKVDNRILMEGESIDLEGLNMVVTFNKEKEVWDIEITDKSSSDDKEGDN